MEELNNKRMLVKILEELSSEMNFEIQFLSEDWITMIRCNQKVHYIYGYEWGINSSTSQLIAKDKEAAYEVLSMNHINAMEHKLFFNYHWQSKYTGKKGCWAEIMRYVQAHQSENDYRIVCKPNRGTGSNDIYRITNQWDLEYAVQKMFSKYRDLCLCPYYEIENEYRAIFLNGEILLLYSKERPYVTGNGKDNLVTLVLDKYKEKGFSFLTDLDGELDTILEEGEQKNISWKHNLGKGAKAVIVKDDDLRNRLNEFVNKVADVLDITFASIDVAVIGGEFYIVEVNSGIMIESFARQQPDTDYNYYELTKDIYRKAVGYLLQH